jgi:hypothetical protein
MHRAIIKVFYLPRNAQVIVLKNNIKIYIKTAPTCFGVVPPSSGSALSVLAKVTLVKIANLITYQCTEIGYFNNCNFQQATNNALPEDGVTTPKHVRGIFAHSLVNKNLWIMI